MTIRFIIFIAAAENWIIYQIDVFNAIMQEDLVEEVYMKFPKGFTRQCKHQVCRLIKLLYGLKQALKQWNCKLTNALTNTGSLQSPQNYSLFTK